MPFPMKIQPVDSYTDSVRDEPGKPVLKSRLRRLFDRQFPSVLKISTAEKPSATETQVIKDGGGGGGGGGGTDFELNSVCLDKMVQNYIEDSSEKPSAQKCGRHRYNCFNGNSNSSDDDFDVLNGFGESIQTVSSADACEMLKCLIVCVTAAERNLLEDTSKIVETHKICKRKDDLRRIVRDGLSSLNYDAYICKSRWEKSRSHPAGEYEFIEVEVEGEILLIDIDFRSEFEIARRTWIYRSILQTLPSIFVGKADRLKQVVRIVSEAAMQSLRKKRMHVPPWRKTEYMEAKWLSPSTRTTTNPNDVVDRSDSADPKNPDLESDGDELELTFRDHSPPRKAIPLESPPSPPSRDEKPATPAVSPWQPPEVVKPRSCEKGVKVVTGFAFLLNEKP